MKRAQPTNDASVAELIVIGGGVLGAFHAYHALARGLRVILLERNARPRGASVRNFGQVVPSGLDQRWQAFGRDSLQIYKQLQSQIDLSVSQLGSIYLASDEDELTLLEELREINRSADYPSQLLTSQQCCQRFPQLKRDYCQGGLFFPEEVSVNPRMMVHRLHAYLDEQPHFEANFCAAVCEIYERDDGKVVATTSDDRVFTAEKAIVCSGSEFRMLFPDIFADSDLVAVKLQMLRLKPQPVIRLRGNILTGRSIRRYESFAQCPSWPAIKQRQHRDEFADRFGVHLLFKQEADGGIILGDSHEYASASQIDDLDFDIRADVNHHFIDEGQKIFDLPSWEIESAWYGVYSQTNHPSGIFLKTLDRNIHVATGIGGKGMTSSAGFAKHHLREIYND